MATEPICQPTLPRLPLTDKIGQDFQKTSGTAGPQLDFHPTFCPRCSVRAERDTLLVEVEKLKDEIWQLEQDVDTAEQAAALKENAAS